MRAPAILAADFLAAFQRLLPRGPVWPRDPDAIQTQALAALMPTYERQTARSNNLLVDAFPPSTLELLPEWEETLGLPDPCQGPSATIQQRRAQVVARFAARGGQSVAYFIQYALNLGFPITITQFAPSRFGQPFGLPFYGVAWAFAWQVNAALVNFHQFAFGSDAFGEPFEYFGNAVLRCELERVQPAHTTLIVGNAGFELTSDPAVQILTSDGGTTLTAG
jgi:uncharacterized protein YmfQ (DUF2313 family)